jgi:hypothetical protein
MPKKKLPPETRGDRNIRWIELNCVQPDGPAKGQRVRLSDVECAMVRELYDLGEPKPVEGRRLSAYIALLHLCGFEHGTAPPPLAADLFTVWNAAQGERVRDVLTRKADVIVCPELGTRFPHAA